MKKSIWLLLLISSVIWIPACEKQETEITYFFYEGNDWERLNQYLDLPKIPFKYQSGSNASSSEIVFNHGLSSQITLGRTLFYDKNISADGKIACASCHLQSHAFSDTLALSNGVNGRQTKRNSLALGAVRDFSSAYGGSAGNFFWDDRAFNLQNQCVETLNNPDEMGVTLNQVVQTISNREYYKILAKYANLGKKHAESIDSSQVLDALAAFMSAMRSDQSKFDAGMKIHNNKSNVSFSNFTYNENYGKSLFIEHCGGCHGTAFTRSLIPRANNGLSPNPADPGRWNVTHEDQDRNVFKVPLLRNVALTAPYMHDGRFQTLEEVIDHYSKNVVLQENLHTLLKVNNGGIVTPRQFNFSAEDKQALIDFLNTLTDTNFTNDIKFSDPFRK